MRLILLIAVMIAAGMCYGELKVGDESAEAWKDRVFKTNDCAWTAFHAGRVSGFLDGYDMAEDRYASDDCLTAGECDDRANVRWIQGWQDGAEAIRQCYSNDFQNGYAIGYLRGQIECASNGYRVVTNTVYVTNECTRQHIITGPAKFDWPQLTNAWNVQVDGAAEIVTNAVEGVK